MIRDISFVASVEKIKKHTCPGGLIPLRVKVEIFDIDISLTITLHFLVLIFKDQTRGGKKIRFSVFTPITHSVLTDTHNKIRP